jgi:hypothetical protein
VIEVLKRCSGCEAGVAAHLEACPGCGTAFDWRTPVDRAVWRARLIAAGAVVVALAVCSNALGV